MSRWLWWLGQISNGLGRSDEPLAHPRSSGRRRAAPRNGPTTRWTTSRPTPATRDSCQAVMSGGRHVSIRRSAQYVSGSASSSESTRSRMPPKPGSQVPASLTPNSRFAADSRRSPQTDPRPDDDDQADEQERAADRRQGGREDRDADGGAQQVPISPSRVLFGESDGASGTRPEPLADDERADIRPGTAEADRGDEQDAGLASLGSERDAVREHDAEDDQADGGEAEVADRPVRVRPDDRQERAGEHEPTDEQVGGRRATQRRRDHDRQARDLEGHEVMVAAGRRAGSTPPGRSRRSPPAGSSATASRPRMATARMPASAA